MKEIQSGVTAAKGFFAAGAVAGIKYENRKDMALVYTKESAVCAGTFTTNVVKAAPVIWDQKIVADGSEVHAVVLNSGIANACTGEEGKTYNYEMAKAVADEFNIKPEQVLTASTGVIGMQLRLEPIKGGVTLLKENLGEDAAAATAAAEAIMTTDTISKQVAVEFEIGGKPVHVGGMSKGSGMIHPNMATMLSVITTDACIAKEPLQKALSEVVADSFNMISVDRDTSTNDTCVVLANAMSETGEIKEDTKEYEDFKAALNYVAVNLAKLMAGDGEGCTKLFETKVIGAKTKKEAKTLAKSVITSNLVKTAVFGSDANWGRIVCALGYAGVDFDPEIIDLTLSAEGKEMVIVKDGVATGYSEEEATNLLSQEYVSVICDMKQGDATATAWGCDLTYDYVKINGDYRS